MFECVSAHATVPVPSVRAFTFILRQWSIMSERVEKRE
jgi:hypothetical protein